MAEHSAEEIVPVLIEKEPDGEEPNNLEDTASQVSSDDEHEMKLPEKPAIANQSSFTFYNFGYHLVPFHDLLDSFYNLRKTFLESRKKSSSNLAESKSDTISLTSSKKAFDITEFQRTQDQQRQNPKTAKISRFRPAEPKWDGTTVPDKDLIDNLYRTPQSDPSGKVIFSVVRDEAKDATPWKPPERNRDLPVPTLDKCNPRLQLQILAHMNDTIAKVEKEYAAMPATTQSQTTLKASMGADLDNLKRQRDQLLRHMKKKKHTGVKPNALFGGI